MGYLQVAVGKVYNRGVGSSQVEVYQKTVKMKRYTFSTQTVRGWSL